MTPERIEELRYVLAHPSWDYEKILLLFNALPDLLADLDALQQRLAQAEAELKASSRNLLAE